MGEICCDLWKGGLLTRRSNLFTKILFLHNRQLSENLESKGAGSLRERLWKDLYTRSEFTQIYVIKTFYTQIYTLSTCETTTKYSSLKSRQRKDHWVRNRRSRLMYGRTRFTFPTSQSLFYVCINVIRRDKKIKGMGGCLSTIIRSSPYSLVTIVVLELVH